MSSDKKVRERIVDAWFENGFNAPSAWRTQYPNASRDSAKVDFCRMKKNDEHIKEYINKKFEENRKKLDASHERVLKELLNAIELDPTVTLGIDVEELKELPIEIKRLITRTKETRKDYFDNEGNLVNTETQIQLWFFSKEKAHEMIHKHIGFYEKDNMQKESEIDFNKISDKALLELANARK